MTKRRLRYSDLAAAAPAPENPPAPAISEVSAAVVAAPAPAIAVPITAAEVLPEPRKRRNSTPVQLARALAAAQVAERSPTRGPIVAAVPAIAVAVGAPHRSLRDRARAREGIVELLMFRIGGERFGVELAVVDEVIDLPVIHHIPEMPPAMLGVVTVRGSLTPVYSPHDALGLPLALRDAVLIFRREGVRVGILIDDVDDAATVDLGELRETPGAEQADSVVLGVLRHAGAIVGLVEADALIAACQIAALLEIA